jgi:outer membrane protein assembly factor BamB
VAAAAAAGADGAGRPVLEGHFSYYALDAATGDVVWKHEEGDFLDARQGPREQVRG